MVALRHDLLSLYGPAFAVGANALILLAAGHLVNATLGLSGSVIAMGGWSRMLLGNNIAAAAVNIAVALALIPRYGMVGTAVAAFVSVTFISVLMLVEVRIVYGIYPVGWSMLKPFLAGAVALAAERAVAGRIDHVGLRIPVVIMVGWFRTSARSWSCACRPRTGAWSRTPGPASAVARLNSDGRR